MASSEPLEKYTQEKILQWLAYKKIFAWANKTQGTFDPKRKVFRTNKKQLKGVPDILGILPDGRFLGIEVKRRPNILSPDQIAFRIRAKASNAVCLVAYSLEDVTEFFAYEFFVVRKPQP